MIRLILEQDKIEGDYPEPLIKVGFEHEQEVCWNDLLESFLKGLNTLGFIVDVEEMMDVLQNYTEERLIQLINRSKE